MLKKFKVKNYMCFDEEMVFDLGMPNSYEFNNKLITDGIVSKAIVIGKNAAGKTNLGFAIMDIAQNLTDKKKPIKKSVYLNLFNPSACAEFEYTFSFDGKDVVYSYSKKSRTEIVTEELYIDNTLVIKNNKEEQFVRFKGSESLNIPKFSESGISLVKYVYANSQLDISNNYNKIFLSFMTFVQNMLWFSSAEGNRYIGFENCEGNIYSYILSIDGGSAKPLETFLRNLGIEYELTVGDDYEDKTIFCKMGDKFIPLSLVVSSGTRSLIFFYLWYKQLNKVSFVYIDEFDAFYHTELSLNVLKKITEVENVQAIFTTHNTDLITNEELRPDCIFNLGNNTIKSLANLTPKALREAHNLQKMYKAGAFNE